MRQKLFSKQSHIYSVEVNGKHFFVSTVARNYKMDKLKKTAALAQSLLLTQILHRIQSESGLNITIPPNKHVRGIKDFHI